MKPEHSGSNLNRRDLTGQRFGLWEIAGYAARRNGHHFWRCVCACGAERDREESTLVGGRSRGCTRCRASKHATKHGHASDGKLSQTYRSWLAMRDRCARTTHHEWKNYGGKGVSVCAPWQEGFEAFLSDMGIAPPGTQIDRIDGAGNYEPGNCRWATPAENTRNRKSTKLNSEAVKVIRFLYDRMAAKGKARTMARLYGINFGGLRSAVTGRTWREL